MDAEELLTALAALRRALRRTSARPHELSGLSGAQLELVRLLRKEPGLSVADAAAQLRLAPNTVSTLVGRLADAGVLVKHADEDDRRVARLDLAPGVRRRVEAWRDRRFETLDRALAGLAPADRRRLEDALAVLGRLTAAVEEEQP
jgi:DNA-binding MarR family transcriptional regulator